MLVIAGGIILAVLVLTFAREILFVALWGLIVSIPVALILLASVR